MIHLPSRLWSPRITLAIIGGIVGAGGCAPQPRHPSPRHEDQPPEETRQAIRIEGGSADALTPAQITGKQERLWHVEWKQARAITAPRAPHAPTQQLQLETGTMLGVTGTIFQAQRPVTTFRADRGEADRTHQMLTLEDHVRVTAIKDGSRLNCDRLVYDARGKFYRATGHVTILGPAGQVGTLSEVLTTPDLAVVATPELFPLPPLTRSAGAIQP